MIRYAGLLIGIVITGLGVLGLAAPETFLAAVAYFQVAHRIYIAGALRVVVGAVVFLSAPESRLPRTLRTLGVAGAVLGVLTPVFHRPLPLLVAGLWSGDNVRPWAIMTAALGLVIIGALAPPREVDD